MLKTNYNGEGEELRGDLRYCCHVVVPERLSKSPDGAHMASGSDDRTTRIWDAWSGARIRTLTGHTAEVWSVRKNPTPEEKVRLADGFDKLFSTVTGYTALAVRIAKSKSKKD